MDSYKFTEEWTAISAATTTWAVKSLQGSSGVGDEGPRREIIEVLVVSRVRTCTSSRGSNMGAVEGWIIPGQNMRQPFNSLKTE